GMNSKYIEKCVASAFDMLGDDLTDPLPEKIRSKFELCHKRFAMQNIHFPENSESLEIAKKRLVFEELLDLQLGLLMLKSHKTKEKTEPIKNDFTAEFIKKLPFSPTGAQLRAIKTCVKDMANAKPMSRLLQGDVGSGKTAVAAALLYNAAKNGFQSSLMAPTEILAAQHYSSIAKMMNGTGVCVMLLTGSTPTAERRKILELLKCGEIDILIGTHALIQNGVDFKNLGLVITDEQHRFGVGQRSSLLEKGNNPHTLVMSATPIPRTLALVIYGDLDISVLDEMPAGRKPVETYAVSSKLRSRAYAYVKKHLDKGQQGYIVCPMVDENEDFDLASAVKFYESLQKGFFKDYKLGLLHGKMKSAEKDAVMKGFANGEIQLLVATTVIEVGVDVPNSNIMVIENAERFGLSQLHQLRGRVGRGDSQATCILISDAENDEAKCRLKVMCDTTDGFKIAAEDLKLRGPGDFFGSKQHGLPTLKIASIFDDRSVLKSTSALAREILKADPKLQSAEFALLKQSVEKLFKNSFSGGYN
ncbi:MAG: ATP-dependent DNA helicase RecG, partial [Acutalibacteraceae bacterium]|nr:ATP-dependent DNA helicase RecG [Acutalibacteraceae bacterium]